MFRLHERPPEPREYQVTSLAYSPDGTELAAGTGLMPAGRGRSRGQVLHWKLPADSSPTERHACQNYVRAVAYSACGEWFVFGSGSGDVHAGHRATGWTAVLTGHTRPPVTLTVGPGQHTTILSGAADKYTSGGGGEALLFEVAVNSPFEPSPNPVGRADGSGATAVAWSPVEPDRIAIAQQRRVELRRIGRPGLRKLLTPTQPVSLAFSPDGRTLAAAMGWTVRMWRIDGEAKPEPRDLKGHDQRVNAVAFHPTLPLLASASTDRTLRLWDWTAGREVARYDWNLGPVRSIAFHPDGTTAAAGGEGIVVFDVE